METLERLVSAGRTPRVIGFDDAPFERAAGSPVKVSGVVCAGTRMEGMVWGTATRDGADATDVLVDMLRTSKFHAQVHLVLLDGIAVGGFNVVDLPRLHAELSVPCVAVMRRQPDLAAVRQALARLPHAQRRLDLLERAGPIHESPPFVFQCVGASPTAVGRVLPLLTDRGHVPEALRLAHLIGAAVVLGQSGRRA